MPESLSAATDLDLISYLKAISDARMQRADRIPAWYLLLVEVLGILSGCQSLRDLERFAIRHHSVLSEALGIELRPPASDSAFRYSFRQVEVADLSAAIRDWTIAQIPCGAADLDQLVCDGKTLRGSIVPTACGDSAYGLRSTTFTLPRSPFSPAPGAGSQLPADGNSQPEEAASPDPQPISGKASHPFRGKRSRDQPRPQHHLDSAGKTSTSAHS